MTVEGLLAKWKKDSVINQNALDQTAIDGALLHSKYLDIYTVAKLRLKKAEFDLAIMKRDLWMYYNAKMTQAQMDEKGWPYDPFNGMAKPLKGDMAFVDDAKEIMDTIKWRFQTLKLILGHRQFVAGA